MDIRFTVDGVPILMHDATLGRTTNDLTNAAVNTLSLETIKTLDAGSWFDEIFTGEAVPTLEEALSAIDGRAVAIIEIKASYPNAEEIVYEIITNYNMEHKSVIMSFDENLIKGFKKLDNQFPTVLLLSTFIGDINVLAQKD